MLTYFFCYSDFKSAPSKHHLVTLTDKLVPFSSLIEPSIHTLNKNSSYIAHQQLAAFAASQKFLHQNRASFIFNTHFEKINSAPLQYACSQIQSDKTATSAFGKHFAANTFAPLMAACQWRNQKAISNNFVNDYAQLQSNICNNYQNNNNYLSTKNYLNVSQQSDSFVFKEKKNSFIDVAATSASSSRTEYSASLK